jgi:hypothetical protein
MNDCEDGEFCVGIQVDPGTWLHACSTECAGSGDCPAAPSGTAWPECIPVENTGGCVLVCEGGATCPSGMECYDLGLGHVCLWP